MSKALKYVFLIIVLYLVVIHFTGFSKDVATIGASANGLVANLMGRNHSANHA